VAHSGSESKTFGTIVAIQMSTKSGAQCEFNKISRRERNFSIERRADETGYCHKDEN